jgi:hypothetical protein
MVWKPAEGGETLSAEAWAAGETTEAEAQAGTTEVAVVEVAVEIVAEPAETDDLLSPPGAEPDAAAEEGPVP